MKKDLHCIIEYLIPALVVVVYLLIGVTWSSSNAVLSYDFTKSVTSVGTTFDTIKTLGCFPCSSMLNFFSNQFGMTLNSGFNSVLSLVAIILDFEIIYHALFVVYEIIVFIPEWLNKALKNGVK